MSIVKKYAKLRGMSDDELIQEHDEVAKGSMVGVNYYLDELARREQDRATNAMLKYTRWITIMTIIMTIATIVNVMVALIPQ